VGHQGGGHQGEGHPGEEHPGEGYRGDCRHLPLRRVAASPHRHLSCFRLPQLLAELAPLGEVFEASDAPNTPGHVGYESPGFVVVVEALEFVAVGQAPEVVAVGYHQEKIITSGWNDSVRVDGVHQSRQRYPGGVSLGALRQYHASRSISPYRRGLTVSSRAVILLF